MNAMTDIEHLDDSIVKTASELLRDRWTMNSYPVNQCMQFPLKVLRLLDSTEAVEQRFIGEFTPFINELTPMEYLERINLLLEHSEYETHFTFEAQIAQPRKAFVLTTRRWFKQSLPALCEESLEPLIDLLLETYMTRPIYSAKKGQKEWYRQHNNERELHPIRLSRFRDDIGSMIDEGGMISLRRYGIVLNTRNERSDFYRKYRGSETYSVK